MHDEDLLSVENEKNIKWIAIISAIGCCIVIAVDVVVIGGITRWILMKLMGVK